MQSSMMWNASKMMPPGASKAAEAVVGADGDDEPPFLDVLPTQLASLHGVASPALSRPSLGGLGEQPSYSEVKVMA
jgi:hypothetical protein